LKITNEELLTQIRKQITAYQMNVRSDNKAHRYNINDRAEAFTIPLFKLLFGWENLENLNIEQPNYPGIDLGDFENRIAVQVSSETNLHKVKDTLQKFVDQEYFDQFDWLIIFMIQEKQKSYNQKAIDRICKDKLEFDPKRDIIDLSDLMQFIKDLLKKELEEVLTLFQDETGYIENTSGQVEKAQINSHFYQPCWNIHGNVINVNIQERSPGAVEKRESAFVDRALVNQIGRLASYLTLDTEERLEEIRGAWHEGKKEVVYKWLSEQKSNVDRWEALSRTVQAKILRFEASLELDRTQDIVKAKQLADQARELTPEDDETRLRALIAYREEGPDRAVELLESKDDIDSINLRAAFLLESGKVEESQQLLREILVDKGLEPDAETHRLNALAFILEKNINQAQVEIQKANAIAPNWESIKYTKAIVDYFSSLSPIAIQSGHIYWPVPIPEDLVKTDDESRARLSKAAKIFHELANSSDYSNVERLTFKIWYMACLLNHSDTKEEAINICKSILGEYPTDIRAIAWATSRRLDIDLDPSKKELKKLHKDGLADIPHILALVNIYQSNRKIKGSIYLLDKTQMKFMEIGAETLWYFWYSQLLTLQGNPEAALKKIEESKVISELKHAKTVVLHAITEKRGNWKPLIDHLESSYQETGDPYFLLDICQIMAQLKNWDYVADRGKELISLVQTGESLRIVAFASYESGRLEKTLELLNDYQNLFPENILPAELSHLRVVCKQNLGIISEAISDAERNAFENPTMENLLTLIDICFLKGDLPRLVIHARKVVREYKLESHIYLRLSRMVYLEDQELALSLWKKSLTSLPDSLVVEALELGYRLGRDNETRPLMARMHKLGLRGEGGIQIATLEDIKGFVAQQQEIFVYLNEIYNDGTAPIHIIAEQLNRSLSTFYHSLLEVNEKSPNQLKQFSLLSRHGGRILISRVAENVHKRRLNLDITAVLLAEHLGILNNVENAFKPIRIPSLTVPALTQMREKAAFHQPSRINNLRIVNQFVENGKLKIIDKNVFPAHSDENFVRDLGNDWIALYQEAKANDGYLVDFLPKKKIGEVDSLPILPAGAEKILVNCRAVIDTLRQYGPLSQTIFESVIEKLGTEGIKKTDAEIPRIGSSLYCYANTIEILASTGILTTICDAFDVHIGRIEHQKTVSDLKELERMEEEVKWIGQLINKINIGIDQGVYEVIPMLLDVDREEFAINNPSLGCIITLLKFDYQEDDVIWVDDRFINGYSRRDAIPIIGINEVLKFLVSVGELSNDDYFAILNRIRASNLRFIPVQSDEILYQIRQARLEKGQLIETQEINYLKRYIAASLFHGRILQRPLMQDGTSNQLGEVEFLLGLGREIIGVVIELWISEKDENTCLAKADWLLSNLYLDHLGMSEAINWHRPNQDDLFLLAVSLSSFIAQAITFPTKDDDGFQDRRKKYMDWIYHRILKAKFEANPALQPTVVEILKDSLFRREYDAFKDMLKPVLTAFLQEYFGDLPEDIRNGFEYDTEFMQSMGYTSLIRIGDLDFEPKEFLNALSELVDGNTASVHPLGSEVEVHFKPIDTGGEFAVMITHLGDETNVIIEDDIFLLLSNSPLIREETLLRHPGWFDCDNLTLERNISEIVSKEDPQERINLAEKWRNSSVITFYKKLYDQLSRREPFSLESFRPRDADALLRHHRLNLNMEGGAALREALDSSAKDLIHEVGIFEATNRYLGFPIPIPKSLLEAAKGLPIKEKRSFVKRCLNSIRSPLSKLHFIRLLVYIWSEEEAYYRLAKRVIKSLLQGDVSEFDAYFSVLNWTNNDFNLWPDTRCMPAHIRLLLVWAHAHRIFTIFKSLGTPNDRLESVFQPMYQPITSDLFERDKSLSYDVANPKQPNRPRLVLSGLQYCLGEKASNYIDENAKELLQKVAFTEIGGITGPHLSLIRDFSRATNALGSFIGESFIDMLIPIFEKDVSNLFSQENLKLLIEHAIDKLIEENNDFSNWSQLHAILDGLPPYENMVDQEILLFSGVDFAQLVEENIMLGIVALHIASLQEPYLNNKDLHTILRDEIVNVASVIYNKNLGDETNHQEQATEDSLRLHTHGILLDSSLNLSMSSNQPVDDFEALITRMIDVNPSMIPLTGYMVQRLYDELPINQSKKLSTLLLRLRAEKLDTLKKSIV
jgi:hypothetical protein